MRVDVGALDEFPDGKARVVSVEGRELGIIRSGDEVFAVRNVCPHQFAPVCRGYVGPLIVGEEGGSVEVDEDRLVVVCPWHGWEFDARTGKSAWADSRFKLRTYPVAVDDGRVLVEVKGG